MAFGRLVATGSSQARIDDNDGETNLSVQLEGDPIFCMGEAQV